MEHIELIRWWDEINKWLTGIPKNYSTQINWSPSGSSKWPFVYPPAGNRINTAWQKISRCGKYAANKNKVRKQKWCIIHFYNRPDTKVFSFYDNLRYFINISIPVTDMKLFLSEEKCMAVKAYKFWILIFHCLFSGELWPATCVWILMLALWDCGISLFF